MTRQLMKGNEVIAEAAIRAGCQAYFGYPITPQSELLEYISKNLPKAGGVFTQAESEPAAISMVYGAAATGVKCMTSSSSPGISLMQEGISYLACAELPCVIVDIARGGPGLGTIQPGQADYFQATRGGGHGDYRTIVLAPSSVQEAALLTKKAFDLSFQYRIPVIVLGDGILGQMAEPIDFEEIDVGASNGSDNSIGEWSLRGARGRAPHQVIPFDLDPEGLELLNNKLVKKHKIISKQAIQFECSSFTELREADIVLVAYGIVGRIARTVIEMAEKENIKVGLVRPITLWPFPYRIIRHIVKRLEKDVLVVEMSAGQMIEDVRLGACNDKKVNFLGRTGGVVPTQNEILGKLCDILGKSKSNLSKIEPINPYAEGDFPRPKRIQLAGVNKVFSRPKSLTDDPFSYCPGCNHSTAHRLIAEVVDDLDIRTRTIGVFCVGCAVFGYKFFNIDSVVPAHGKAQAVASAIKEVRLESDNIVFAYQGDGDLAAIGIGKTIHAANRGDNITTIFINNATFGMTGGQMAPTTLLGQVTSTTPAGREVKAGHPLKMAELLAGFEATAFVARVSLTSPKEIIKAKKAIKKAFRFQIEGRGYSFVEILSACPTNWKMTPLQSLDFIKDKMVKEFPLGVFKDKEEEK